MIISKKKKPCCVCGELTNRVDEDYEEFICSEECEKNLNREALVYLKETLTHKVNSQSEADCEVKIAPGAEGLRSSRPIYVDAG